MEHEGKLVLCPYCGATQPAAERCQECGGMFEPLSRKATQVSMGPWYIRDKTHPFRPGCSYEVLVKQIKAGKLKPTTVLRGPTTHQFWSVARNVPGIAHLLGYCHRCGQHVSPDAPACPACHEPFEAVKERNELGLLYSSDAALKAAQRSLDQDLGPRGGGPSAGESGPAGAATPAQTSLPGADLLDEVLKTPGRDSARRGRSARTKPPAPPAATPTPAPAPRRAEVLDFSPGDDSDRGRPAPAPDAGAGRARISPMVIIMIAVNVAIVVGAVVLFSHINRGNTPPPRPNSTPTTQP